MVYSTILTILDHLTGLVRIDTIRDPLQDVYQVLRYTSFQGVQDCHCCVFMLPKCVKNGLPLMFLVVFFPKDVVVFIR